jgi:nucleoside-diphosphate-sugar epimerase
MNIIITGSCGYIGSRLVELVKKQKQIRFKGIDICFYKEIHNYKLIKKDIRDIQVTDLRNADAIIHLAALSNDPLGEFDEKLTYEINYKATINLAKNAKKAGVKKFIFISTQSVYGISKNINHFFKENDKNIYPITAYAKSKYLAEKKILAFADKNFSMTILRPATVHGPSKNFRSDIVLNNLICSAYVNKKIIIKTNGLPYRPLIFIDDLCKIIIACLYKKKKIINKNIYNIGYLNLNLKIIEMAKLVNKKFKNSKIKILNQANHDERSYKVDFKKTSKIFGDIINFKKKNINNDIIKIKNFLKNEKFTKKNFYGEKTNRIIKLKNLIKKKLINKKLRFANN